MKGMFWFRMQILIDSGKTKSIVNEVLPKEQRVKHSVILC